MIAIIAVSTMIETSDLWALNQFSILVTFPWFLVDKIAKRKQITAMKNGNRTNINEGENTWVWFKPLEIQR